MRDGEEDETGAPIPHPCLLTEEEYSWECLHSRTVGDGSGEEEVQRIKVKDIKREQGRYDMFQETFLRSLNERKKVKFLFKFSKRGFIRSKSLVFRS